MQVSFLRSAFYATGGRVGVHPSDTPLAPFGQVPTARTPLQYRASARSRSHTVKTLESLIFRGSTLINKVVPFANGTTSTL